jgi:hypothetical protein
MSNWIIFESIAVFVIWMQRKGRWAAFLSAASGQVVVGGTDRSGNLAYSEDANGKVEPNSGTSAAGVPGGQGSGTSGSSKGIQGTIGIGGQTPSIGQT